MLRIRQRHDRENRPRGAVGGERRIQGDDVGRVGQDAEAGRGRSPDPVDGNRRPRRRDGDGTDDGAFFDALTTRNKSFTPFSAYADCWRD